MPTSLPARSTRRSRTGLLFLLRSILSRPFNDCHCFVTPGFSCFARTIVYLRSCSCCFTVSTCCLPLEARAGCYQASCVQPGGASRGSREGVGRAFEGFGGLPGRGEALVLQCLFDTLKYHFFIRERGTAAAAAAVCAYICARLEVKRKNILM